MRSKEDVISIIRSYCLANDGDEATTDLLLAVGAEILGVSAEEMQKMLAWSDLEPDVPDQEAWKAPRTMHGALLPQSLQGPPCRLRGRRGCPEKEWRSQIIPDTRPTGFPVGLL